MASPIAFVGDAIMASGYRLAGVAVHVPEAGAEVAAFERAPRRGARSCWSPSTRR